ncbi:hypothetical protein BT63DRAFT_451880 [Microthyrium microscopicum]|uniref:Extracellular membrane protein CFEM domain-containing protein n=1 Tax=Microthyrium microscopicum TaxID=703497 RepID=A0A6A6UNG7_9PEZI|nr:hypothetical protein BT63DRAFT_451880 [Microthyrium microscopicum]
MPSKFCSSMVMFLVVAISIINIDAQLGPRIKCCIDAGFQNCEEWNIASDDCFDVPDELNDAISSIVIESGAVCEVYKDYSCRTPLGSFTEPISDIAGLGWNDVISSIMCDFIYEEH